MTEALWVLAGVGTWALITGVDALAGRTKKKLRRAETDAKAWRQTATSLTAELQREKSRRAADLTNAESRHQEEVDGLNAKIKDLEGKVKEQEMMLEQKWKGATTIGTT